MKCVNCPRALQKHEIIKDDFNNDCCGYCGSLLHKEITFQMASLITDKKGITIFIIRKGRVINKQKHGYIGLILLR